MTQPLALAEERMRNDLGIYEHRRRHPRGKLVLTVVGQDGGMSGGASWLTRLTPS